MQSLGTVLSVSFSATYRHSISFLLPAVFAAFFLSPLVFYAVLCLVFCQFSSFEDGMLGQLLYFCKIEYLLVLDSIVVTAS